MGVPFLNFTPFWQKTLAPLGITVVMGNKRHWASKKQNVES